MSDSVLIEDSPNLVTLSDSTSELVLITEFDEIILQDTELSIVTVLNEDVVLISDVVGVQGPPGGTTGQVTAIVTAGSVLNAYRLVVPSVTASTVILADNSVLDHSTRPIWMTLTAALVGEMVQVVTLGFVENPAWSWTVGAIYLGENGVPTQTPPAVPGSVFSAQVGYAQSPTRLYLERGTTVQLA